MIKQRRYRPSATPPVATPSPARSPATPGTAATTPAPAAPSTGRPKGAKVASKGTELGEQIGDKLKTMFEDVVGEPVPDKFRALLEELERKSGKS